MTQETKTALCEWISGLIVGLMPLFAHALLHFCAKADPHWDDNWTLDVLFIAISTSGLSAVTIFSRAIKGTFQFSSINAPLGIFMALTIALFFAAGILYGASASGQGVPVTAAASYVLLTASMICSVYFEFTLARITVGLGA